MHKKILVFSVALLVSGVLLFVQRGKLVQKYLEKTLSSESAPNTVPVPDYSTKLN